MKNIEQIEREMAENELLYPSFEQFLLDETGCPAEERDDVIDKMPAYEAHDMMFSAFIAGYKLAKR